MIRNSFRFSQRKGLQFIFFTRFSQTENNSELNDSKNEVNPPIKGLPSTRAGRFEDFLKKTDIAHKMWNLNLPLEKQIAEEIYSKEIHKNAILFDEILKSNVNIVIYDCKGFYFRHLWLTTAAMVLFFCSGFYVYNFTPEISVNVAWIMNIANTGAIFLVLGRYKYIQKRHVNKIEYNTIDKNFTLHLFNPFGIRTRIKCPQHLLLYTQDPKLNAGFCNYINMKNLDQYMIGFDYGWVDKKLFSHLIKQHIK